MDESKCNNENGGGITTVFAGDDEPSNIMPTIKIEVKEEPDNYDLEDPELLEAKDPLMVSPNEQENIKDETDIHSSPADEDAAKDPLSLMQNSSESVHTKDSVAFTLATHLKKHKRIRKPKGKEKPFSCDECPKSFSKGVILRKHLKQHTGEPFSCHECLESFCHAGNFEKHIAIHKPFSCSDLLKYPKSLSQVVSLKMRTQPFSCHECGKTFAQKGDIITHLRSHTKDKPLFCLKCKKAFAYKLSYEIHMRTPTEERQFSCKKCPESFFSGTSPNNTHENPYRKVQL